MYNNSLYGNYRTRYFTEIYPDVDTFMTDYKNLGIPASVSDSSANLTYYLLYSYYGNSSVANSDENQFRYRLFSTVFRYGPTWEKRLEIQKNLRELSEADLLLSGTNITNHSYNPSTGPVADSDQILETINDQNVNKYKRSKLSAYGELWQLLKVDPTSDYINKFKDLFLVVVEPEEPLWYASYDGEEEEK